MRTVKRTVLLTALAALGAGLAAAQPQQEREKVPPGQKVAWEGTEKAIMLEKMAWVGAEMRLPARTVQGAPYSAHAVTEFTQTLADGNRIVRRSTTLVYRDSEGRVRREIQGDGEGVHPAELGWKAAPGPSVFVAKGMRGGVVVINDPVAGVEHLLDTKNRIAQTHKIMTAPEKGELLEKLRMKVETVQPKSSREGFRTESLGRQPIDGIDAEGTRTITTIPAGQIGNERPIEVVSERWFSPELQIVVRTRHSDPRSGETVYRLTNFSRAEPARSLFDVPADYSVRDPKVEKGKPPR